MRYLTQSSVNLAKRHTIEKLQRVLLCFFLVVGLLLFNPPLSEAKLQVQEAGDGSLFSRSLESLRDVDYQSWQLVVYSKNSSDQNFVFVKNW